MCVVGNLCLSEVFLSELEKFQRSTTDNGVAEFKFHLRVAHFRGANSIERPLMQNEA